MFIPYSLLFHRLEFQSSRKIQEEYISQDKNRRNMIDHTVLGYGDKVSKTESYNCLSVDLVPEGSVRDSLALYFKVCEVECQCHWCYGQLASLEQKLQSLPR
ncbi:hypothetical protein SKAU_G00016890 [Synaphobranchus kaupii]|uniref:Uncharacterized protein n=1 Tax=Synaphobranchus kaupii TaxID=118154 RepID=A0A9Q1GB07_SYNKA|nr:hypothetical protein SKAU_G00016890 [Synaphobranchus kaupii]